MAERQGFLTKQGGQRKNWKKRWMVLKNGAIRYSKKENSGALGVINLEEATEVKLSTSSKKQNCFEVVTPSRTYYLVANSDAEMKAWVQSVEDAMKRLKGQSDDGGNKKVGIDDFDLMKVIGKGSFGKVVQVKMKETNQIYAMKILDKKAIMERNELEHTRSERSILEKLAHPFLVNLNYSFQTPDKLFFVMDFVNGGELFFHLQKSKKFTPERVQFYSAEIVLGLEYLHNSGVLYRDLKPENLLLDEDGHICMTDFGISKEGLTAADDRTATFCGTPEYLAPEVLEGKGYGKPVDWWSFGTLMYEMFTGLPPFYAQDVQQMYAKIMSAKLVVPDTIPDDAKDLLHKLLEREPEKRLSDPKMIKAHPYYASIDWDKLLAKEVTPPFKPPVKSKGDTSQVDPQFTSEEVSLSQKDVSDISATFQKNFDGFTYVGNAMDDDE